MKKLIFGIAFTLLFAHVSAQNFAGTWTSGNLKITLQKSTENTYTGTLVYGNSKMTLVGGKQMRITNSGSPYTRLTVTVFDDMGRQKGRNATLNLYSDGNMSWYNSSSVGISGLPTGSVALRKSSAPGTPAAQPAQSQRSPDIDLGTIRYVAQVPPRSQWNDMVYIDKPLVSHYAGESHGISIYVHRRKEYQGLDIYYEIKYIGNEINFTAKRSDFEGSIPSFMDYNQKFLRYSNSAKPTATMSDFRITVTNVVAK